MNPLRDALSRLVGATSFSSAGELPLLSREAHASLACPPSTTERGGGCRYLTVAIGKIFHPGDASGGNDIAYSWSPETLPYVVLTPCEWRREQPKTSCYTSCLFSPTLSTCGVGALAIAIKHDRDSLSSKMLLFSISVVVCSHSTWRLLMCMVQVRRSRVVLPHWWWSSCVRA